MTLTALAPKNHPRQTKVRGADDSVDDRRTPRAFFDALHAEFAFTVDAAASAENALLPRYFDKAKDGLRQSWFGHMVFVNPPYSMVPAWTRKCFYAMREEHCCGVVMLIPADRTEQPFWQDYIEPHRDCGRGVRTRFVRGRIKFGLPPGHPKADAGLAQGREGGGYRSPPFGCVLVILEPGAAILPDPKPQLELAT